jgi:hypothetical protein
MVYPVTWSTKGEEIQGLEMQLMESDCPIQNYPFGLHCLGLISVPHRLGKLGNDNIT